MSALGAYQPIFVLFGWALIKFYHFQPNVFSKFMCHCSFCVLSPEPAAPQVAWPCAVHGGRLHSQRRPLLYGQVASGSRRVGRPARRFKDTCRRDMKVCKIDTDTWEDAAGDMPGGDRK